MPRKPSKTQTREAINIMAKESRQQHANLLPKDLAEQIIKAAAEERALAIKEFDQIESLIEKLQAERNSILQEAKKLMAVIEKPPIVHTSLRGNRREIQQRSKMSKTQAQIDAEQPARVIGQRINNLTKRKNYLQGYLGSLQRVVKIAESGRVNVLLHMTSQWRNSTILGPVMRILPEPPKTELIHEKGNAVRKDLESR